jgi:membrane protease YdiL (CAAX protease family)
MNAEPSARTALAHRGETYWIESRQPLASLVFIAPWLAVYEVGVLVLGPRAINGADLWLRKFLEILGFGQYFLLPALTVCLLLAWHHLTRRSWRLSRGVLYGMSGESLLLALLLWFLAKFQSTFQQMLFGNAHVSPSAIRDTLGVAIGYLGAGIYEELLFRLILLTALTWLLRRLGLTERPATALAVVLSSALFALAHHLGANGEPFNIPVFLFRCSAGGFFAILFLYRGFGITAGTHAGYDFLVKLSEQLAGG